MPAFNLLRIIDTNYAHQETSSPCASIPSHRCHTEALPRVPSTRLHTAEIQDLGCFFLFWQFCVDHLLASVAA